jgi:hypothetical protein
MMGSLVFDNKTLVSNHTDEVVWLLNRPLAIIGPFLLGG